MRRKSIVLLMCMALIITMLPVIASATVGTPATEVTLSSGDTALRLDDTDCYLVNGAVTGGTHTLGQNGCTAYFHGGTLEIENLQLTGADNTYHSALWVEGDLKIIVHGGNNSIKTSDYTAGGSAPQTRALYVRNGSLTILGNGTFNVTTGNGYGTTSCAISCNSQNAIITVDSGVVLNASVGSLAAGSAADDNYGIQTSNLINHGQITATGDGAGIYLGANGTAGTENINDGQMTAIGTTGSGMILSGKSAFTVNGGTVELTGAAGNPAIGKTVGSEYVGILAINPSITTGYMGTGKDAATVHTSQEIVAHYSQQTAPTNSYLKLPGPVEPTLADDSSPPTGDSSQPLIWLGIALMTAVFSSWTAISRRRQ